MAPLINPLSGNTCVPQTLVNVDCRTVSQSIVSTSLKVDGTNVMNEYDLLHTTVFDVRHPSFLRCDLTTVITGNYPVEIEKDHTVTNVRWHLDHHRFHPHRPVHFQNMTKNRITQAFAVIPSHHRKPTPDVRNDKIEREPAFSWVPMGTIPLGLYAFRTIRKVISPGSFQTNTREHHPGELHAEVGYGTARR